MPLSGQIGMHALLTQSAANPLGTATYPFSYPKNWDITNGTGLNQADLLFTAQRTIASATNDDLDLTGLLTGAFGATILLVKVKCLMVEALASNTTNLTVGNAAANPFQGPFGAVTHTLVLKPGDFCLIASPGSAGWGVTAGTGDLLRVANAAGASALYNIAVIGTSA